MMINKKPVSIHICMILLGPEVVRQATVPLANAKPSVNVLLQAIIFIRYNFQDFD
jgi:hypothetical protein